MSFFRYPGGKSKLNKQILAAIDAILTETGSGNFEYREPFFGGGSIGLSLLKNRTDIKKAWINDKDPGVASLWTSVIKYPGDLISKVDDFKKGFKSKKDAVKYFAELQQEVGGQDTMPSDPDDIVDLGFKKLAVHQMSYSGLGTKAGGPIGGQDQASDYDIWCRWSPKYICKKIKLLNEEFSKVSVRDAMCGCSDFACVVQDTGPAITYLDPPYYEKGGVLYQCSFAEKDHKRLAGILCNTNNPWVLSYDECVEVRDLYAWAYILEIREVNYSITALKTTKDERISRWKTELLIVPKKFGRTVKNVLEKLPMTASKRH